MSRFWAENRSKQAEAAFLLAEKDGYPAKEPQEHEAGLAEGERGCAEHKVPTVII